MHFIEYHKYSKIMRSSWSSRPMRQKVVCHLNVCPRCRVLWMTLGEWSSEESMGSASVSSFEESLTLTAIYVSLWMAATGNWGVWTKASSSLPVAHTSAEKATTTKYTKGSENKSFAAMMLTSATGMCHWSRWCRPSLSPRKRPPYGWSLVRRVGEGKASTSPVSPPSNRLESHH